MWKNQLFGLRIFRRPCNPRWPDFNDVGAWVSWCQPVTRLANEYSTPSHTGPWMQSGIVWRGWTRRTDRLTYLRPSGLLGYVGLVKLQVIDLGVDRVPFDGAKPIKGDDPEDEIGDSWGERNPKPILVLICLWIHKKNEENKPQTTLFTGRHDTSDTSDAVRWWMGSIHHRECCRQGSHCCWYTFGTPCISLFFVRYFLRTTDCLVNSRANMFNRTKGILATTL